MCQAIRNTRHINIPIPQTLSEYMKPLRVANFSSLTRDDLDTEIFGLHLRAEWTKNRQSGFQPLPESLVKRLYEFSVSGKVEEIYAKCFTRQNAVKAIPDNPLLYVPTNPAR